MRRSGTRLGLHLVVVLLTSAGCQEAAGDLEVLIEPETVILDGLEPGEDTENIADGWAVTFDDYIVAIGDVELELASSGDEAHDHGVFAVDLASLPASGATLWTFEGLAEGRWDLHYATAGAGHAPVEAHGEVSAADVDAMTTGDWTYLIRGTISRSDGVSCPPPGLATPDAGLTPSGQNAAGVDCYDNPAITFELGASAETVYGPCEVDGVPGVAIGNGSTTTAALTIHGDHLFFNGFPEGDEGGAIRLAQWMADCDLNLDGQVTRDELAAIAPSDLSELDDRFQLGGSPISPLDNMWTYVRAQLKTQGHFQGEGECPADGAAHDH